jgi:hypothetical protein
LLTLAFPLNTYKPKENHGYEGNDGPITNYNRIRYPAIPYITGSEGSIISTIGYTAARDYNGGNDYYTAWKDNTNTYWWL